MGAKKIEAKRQEFLAVRKKASVITEAVAKVTAAMKAIKDKEQALADERKKAALLLGGLDVGGDKVLSEAVAAVVAALKEPGAAVPTVDAGLRKYTSGLEQAHAQMLDEWVKKHEASMPKEVKVGMSFKSYVHKGAVIEIIKGPTLATNANLTGDKKVWFEIKFSGGGMDGKTVQLSLADLKDGSNYKYLNM